MKKLTIPLTRAWHGSKHFSRNNNDRLTYFICVDFINKLMGEETASCAVNLHISFSPPKRKGWKKVVIQKTESRDYCLPILVSVSGGKPMLEGLHVAAHNTLQNYLESNKLNLWMKVEDLEKN